jgi:autotransporter-associated beta strand protein
VKASLQSLALVAVVTFLVVQSAHGAARTWGNAGTNFNSGGAGGNWSGAAAPGANDVALFATPQTAQPTLTLSLTIAGLRFSAGATGYDITNSGGAVLTLNGVDTTGGGNTTAAASAIRNDNTTGTTTIDAPLTLAPSTLISTIFQDAADGSTLILNGAIGQTGTVALSLKNGTIQLNGTNTYSGGTSIDAAGTTLVLGNDSALGTGALTINNSSTLQAGGGSRSISNAINFGVDTTISGSNSFNFAGNITLSGAGATRTLTINNSAATSFSGSNIFLSDLAGTGRTLVINGSGATSISAAIANFNGAGTAGNLTYSGTSTLTLSGANTYGGTTTLSSGTLNINSTTALGTGSFALNGGAIDNTNGGTTLSNNNAVTWGGDFTFGGTNNLNFGTGAVSVGGDRIITLNGSGSTLTFGGTVSNTGGDRGLTVNGAGNTLSLGGFSIAPAATNRTLTISGTGNVNITGPIVNGGTATASNLTYSGTGTLKLSGANTYAGTTTINSGSLQISGGSAIADSGLVTLGSTTANTFDVQSSETIGALSGGSASIGVVNLASGQTLTLSSGTKTFSGTFSGPGTLKIDGAAETIASAVTLGAANLMSGTLTLSSANTITNGLTISGGTLNIGDNNALGTGTLTINGGTLQSNGNGNRNVAVTQINVGGDFSIGGANTGALSFAAPVDLGGATRQITDDNTANTTTFGGTISNGGLIKAGNGTLALNGANTFTGGVTINAGTVTAGSTTALGPAANATLTFGSGSTGRFQLNNNNITVIDLNTNANVGTPIIENGGGAATKTLTVNTANTDIYAGVLQDGAAGVLALTKSGAGSLTLSGANTYSGTTTLSSGGINANSATAFGTSISVVMNGITLDNTSGAPITLTNNNPMSWGGNNIFTGTNDLNLGTGAVSLTANRTWTINNGTLTVGGAIGDSGGSRSLKKDGAGTFVLSGQGTFTGGMTLLAGTLGIGADTTPTSGTVTSGPVGTGILTLSGGAIQAVGAGHTVANVITLTSDTSVTGVQNLTLNGALTQTGNKTLTNNIGVGKLLTLGGQINLSDDTTPHTLTFAGTGDTTVSGVITNGVSATSGSVTITDTGLTTFSAANTYSGTTTLGASNGPDAGTLRLSGAGTLGATTNPVALRGGTLDLNGTTQTIGALLLGGGASGSTPIVTIGSGNLNLGGNVTYSATNNPNGGTISGIGGGALSLNGTRTFNIGDSTAAAADLTVSAIIQDGTGSNGITKTGAGTLLLSGANTYTGGTTLSAGTLNINSSSAIGTGALAISGGTTIDNTSGSAITLSTNNHQNWNGDFTFTGTNDLNLGTGIVGLNNADRQVTVTNSNATLTVGGVISDGTVTSPFHAPGKRKPLPPLVVSGLTKAGAGTLFITGANVYGGATNINAGTLKAGVGSLVSVGGAINVNGGGTLLLDGAGRHIGANTPVNMNGGTFNTGGFSEPNGGASGLATSAIGALTLTATSTIDFGTSNTSILEFSGLGTHTATTVLQITDWDGVPLIGGSGDRLLFIGLATSFTTAYSQTEVSFNGTLGYTAVQFDPLNNPYYEIVATPVPEPGTWGAGALALLAIGYTQRRRFTRLLKPA